MNKVALIQTNSSDEVAQNLRVLTPFLAQAVDEGARVIVLPENFALMRKTHQQLLDNAETHGSGPIQDYLRKFALQKGVWIVAGSLPLRSEVSDKVVNSQLVYNDRGDEVARYDKIHLFDVDLSATESYRESDIFLPGQDVAVINTPLGKMGLSICYDLRFPELYRKMAKLGAELFVVPAAFTVPTGRAHWEVLLRARAIENSCYVLAAAQFGQHANGRCTYGHSMAIDPWGRVVAQKEHGWGVLMANIELKELYELRERLPSLQNARHELFSG